MPARIHALGLFFLGVAAPALAGDVSVQLDAGAGFSVRNSSGAIERLRVDEATGNVSRNGALFVHTTGSGTFFGEEAGNLSVSGYRNTAFGRGALSYDVTGSDNSAFGNAALNQNTSGSRNAAFGNGALLMNTTGLGNGAFGVGTLTFNQTGSYNVAVGTYALHYTNGSSNTAIGDRALRYAYGSSNIAIGRLAGAFAGGNDNIFVGSPAGSATENGRIRIGTSGLHTTTRIAGIRGTTTGLADAIPVLIDSAGQLGTASSSRAVKTDIRDMGDATERLLELRPVTFRYRAQSQALPSGDAAPPEYGFVAEEVAEIFPDLVVYDDEGKPFTVKYHELAPMLLNEMQRERSAHAHEMAALGARIARLEEQLRQQAR